jgi:glutathione reductase (NADPH)
MPVPDPDSYQNFANTARPLFFPLISLSFITEFSIVWINPSNVQVGTIGLTESEAVAQYGVDKVSVYETAFTAMYFALTSRKQV